MKNLLFDLDGTLLPMNEDLFVKVYFGELTKKAKPYGFEENKLTEVWWKGTAAMVKNDGSRSNEAAFWEVYQNEFGISKDKYYDVFIDFYLNEFNIAISACRPNKLANEIITICKEKGLRLFLATNPIFPKEATENRIRWAGLNPSDFDDITTYETSCYCKPNLAYYQSILDRHNLVSQETMMIGNDVQEDLISKQLGLTTFLVTDCLLNRKEEEIITDYQGSLSDLLEFIKKI